MSLPLWEGFRLSERRVSDAEKCRDKGWVAGTRLVGDEGYGPTVIEITAVGREGILAVQISHNGQLTHNTREGHWTLSERDWKEDKL